MNHSLIHVRMPMTRKPEQHIGKGTRQLFGSRFEDELNAVAALSVEDVIQVRCHERLLRSVVELCLSGAGGSTCCSACTKHGRKEEIRRHGTATNDRDLVKELEPTLYVTGNRESTVRRIQLVIDICEGLKSSKYKLL